MSKKSKVEKWQVALGLSKKTMSLFLADVKIYVQKMTGNASFPTPNPALSVITTQLNLIEAAYNASKSRTLGAAAQMHADRELLMVDLNLLAAYVASVANKDPEHGEAIIQSAGMQAKKKAQRAPKVFSVTPGPVSGSINLSTKAEPKSMYVYQMSTDLNNPASWVEIYRGLLVKFTKTGLTVGSHIYLRAAVLDKTGAGDFGSPVSYIVI